MILRFVAVLFFLFFFFFNDTATTEIYPLSLHDALPISPRPPRQHQLAGKARNDHLSLSADRPEVLPAPSRDHARTTRDALAELQKLLLLFSQRVTSPSASCDWPASPASPAPSVTPHETPSDPAPHGHGINGLCKGPAAHSQVFTDTYASANVWCRAFNLSVLS